MTAALLDALELGELDHDTAWSYADDADRDAWLASWAPEETDDELDEAPVVLREAA